MSKTKALVILSGGQDSTTVLFHAKQQYEEVHAVTFDYGQKHTIELTAAKKVGELAGVTSHEFIDVRGLLHSTSPLVDLNAELEQYENHDQMEGVIGDRIETTFVPMRNQLFLTIATNRAVELGIRNVYLGICQADNANYPDCTNLFLNTFAMLANCALGVVGTNKQILYHAPLIFKTKAQSVEFAAQLPGCFEALAYSHTSYDGKYPPTDMNHANVLRAYGFEQAGYPDPLVCRAWKEGLMELPITSNYRYVEEVDAELAKTVAEKVEANAKD